MIPWWWVPLSWLIILVLTLAAASVWAIAIQVRNRIKERRRQKAVLDAVKRNERPRIVKEDDQ